MRYIGSKSNLAASIVQAASTHGVHTGRVADLFSGTGAVARAFKREGYSVIAADLLAFPYVLQRAYVQVSAYPPFASLQPYLVAPDVVQPTLLSLADSPHLASDLYMAVAVLNGLQGEEGFIYHNYTPSGTQESQYQRCYFTDENGKRIDAVHARIRSWREAGLLTDDEYYLLLSAALEAVPTVANILGTFGAFKKGNWEARATKPYQLIPPKIIPSISENRAMRGDANTLVGEIVCDLLYLDPPYNNRQYAEYYHLLETLASGTEPEIGGLTGKPIGERQLSRYCTLAGAQEQMTDLVARARCQHILLSYSSDGILKQEKIQEILAQRGTPSPPQKLADHRRYRSDKNRLGTEDGERKRTYLPHTTVGEWLYHVTVTR